jgi:hypothetical protein
MKIFAPKAQIEYPRPKVPVDSYRATSALLELLAHLDIIVDYRLYDIVGWCRPVSSDYKEEA